MIVKLEIRSFKSIEKAVFEPGRVNVLIGANGSGKSNILEAVGVLSAAAGGRVDDEALGRRGVRLGEPALYKSAFSGTRRSPHIGFGAWSQNASYEVSLRNPIKDPLPAWRYHSENLKRGGLNVAGRSPNSKEAPNPDAGWAALKSVELSPRDDTLHLLDALRSYAVFTPRTNALRGIDKESYQREPVGISGGRLENAVTEMAAKRSSDPVIANIYKDALGLIEWARSFDTSEASAISLSRSVGSAKSVIRFKDRHMSIPLSGYDASEGALFVLFHAALAASPNRPVLFAVDNADHALNPRLARALLASICRWHLEDNRESQIFLTTHNPLALDGLPIQNDEVRLFVTDRTDTGRTTINRVTLDDRLSAMAEKGWTLSRLWVMGHLGGVANV